jgi:hypothetical protein
MGLGAGVVGGLWSWLLRLLSDQATPRCRWAGLPIVLRSGAGSGMIVYKARGTHSGCCNMQGSTYGRIASDRERAKSAPTLKDLDFLGLHPNGICLERTTFNALMRTLKYESFGIHAPSSTQVSSYAHSSSFVFMVSVCGCAFPCVGVPHSRVGGRRNDAHRSIVMRHFLYECR